jgi:hypothetical protein
MVTTGPHLQEYFIVQGLLFHLLLVLDERNWSKFAEIQEQHKPKSVEKDETRQEEINRDSCGISGVLFPSKNFTSYPI